MCVCVLMAVAKTRAAEWEDGAREGEPWLKSETERKQKTDVVVAVTKGEDWETQPRPPISHTHIHAHAQLHVCVCVRWDELKGGGRGEANVGSIKEFEPAWNDQRNSRRGAGRDDVREGGGSDGTERDEEFVSRFADPFALSISPSSTSK